MASERIQNILTSVNKRVQQLMEVDRFYVALYDPVRAELEFPLVVDNDKLVETSQTRWTVRPYQGRALLPDRVIDQRMPLLFEHDLAIEIEEAEVEYWPPDGYPLSWLGVPMIFEDQVIGILVAENQNKVGAFGERGKSVLSTIARQAAIAIETARLYEGLERKIASLSAMNEMGQRLTAGIRLSEPEILELIYEQATKVMDTKNMYIALYDEATDTVSFGLAFLDERHVDVAIEKGWQARSAGQGRTEWIIRHREPLFSTTRAESKAWYDQPGRKEYIGQPFASWLGVPMMVGEEVLGVIATYDKAQEYVYDEDDKQVLSLMASQAAVAIENARLLDRETQRAQQLAALQEIGVKLTSQLDLEEVLAPIAQNANIIMSADFSTLFPYDAGQGKFEGGIRKGKAEVVPSTPSNTGLAARIAKTQGAVFAEDATRPSGVKRAFLRNKGVRSFAGVPLVIRGRTVGVLFVNFLETHSFSQEDQETLRLLANQAAVAIENARLYRQLTEKVIELEHAQSDIADRERELVMSGIAMDFIHAVNNLAGPIAPWVTLIKKRLGPETRSDPKVVEYLDNIVREVALVLREAYELRKPLTEPEMIDLEELVGSIVGQIEMMVSPDAEIVFEAEPGLPYVYAVKRQLATAFHSIIHNATRAISGQGRISIKLQQDEDDTGRGEFISIQISDTGCGVPGDKLVSIFQYGTSYWPDGKSTGYGLWRAQGIIQSIGGSISVKNNTPDKGCTFTALLPIAEVDTDSVSDSDSEDVNDV